jgi:hypothetical protein
MAVRFGRSSWIRIHAELENTETSYERVNSLNSMDSFELLLVFYQVTNIHSDIRGGNC